MANKLSMPMASWTVLKRIVRAYGTVGEEETATVEQVANRAGMQRTIVSSNNNFLRDIGVLLPAENKLTVLGLRLARCLALENEDMIAEALQEIIRSSPALNQFISLVRARGTVKTDVLRGEVLVAAEVADSDKMMSLRAKSVLDMLHESRLIELNEDVVRVGSTATKQPELTPSAPPNEPLKAAALASPNAALGQAQMPRGIPLPLGPTRLAYLQLPDNWEPKELSKLIKLLQIALGDESNGN
jgi:hypothetical protein